MSDRYVFLKKWNDPESGKTFNPGSVIRTSPGQAAPLIESGILEVVEAGTLCRQNPLAENSCIPVTEAQKTAYTNAKLKSLNKK